MGVNDATLTMFDAYLSSVKQMVMLQIDMIENRAKNYVRCRFTTLDFYEQLIIATSQILQGCFHSLMISRKCHKNPRRCVKDVK